MADEKEKKEEGSKKSSGMVLIIVGVLIVLILVIGGLVVFLLLSGNDESAEAGSNTGATQQQQQPVQRRQLDNLTIGPMFPLEQFIVNLLSDSGRRFLKTTIDLELSDDDLIEELGAKNSRIRDVVIRVLSSKTVEEISTPKGKDKLKKELSNQLNAVLLDGQIVRVYFTDFVIQ